MSEFQASNFKKENGGTPDLLGKTELTSPYFFVPPSGDTASRPESCAVGTLRFNTDIGTLEVYKGDGIGWEQIQKQPSVPIGTRGLISGGDPNTNVIEFITIATTGNGQDFGDLQEAKNFPGSCASHTRGLIGGGATPTKVNTIDFVNIAVLGNGQNFGDLTVSRNELGCTSNSTRGIWWNGSPGHSNVLDFSTIPSQGNATDFGDSTLSRDAVLGGIQSPTRAIASGGNNSGTRQDTIEYVTIMSTGNAIDFGNLTEARNTPSCSNSVRGISAGGDPNSSAGTNIVDFITIATTGNSTDFGDLSQARRNQSAVASPTRAVCYGGKTGSTELNTIDFCTIATLGNYVDFGDTLTTPVGRCGLSNGHGGL
tara:strand:- start:580 stop:1686 length:1107 start_codon:yes stop_codon:yes gene_type:complete